jgi:hypothetical protein
MHTVVWTLSATGLVGVLGCQQSAATLSTASDGVQLAAWAEQAPTTTAPPTRQPTTRPATRPTSRPARSRGYSAPGTQVQQLSFLAVLATTPGAIRLTDGGREGSESAIGAAGGLGSIGRLGMDAPQPTVVDAVVTRAGLQRGFAAGIGFAGASNIFTPAANPVSGSMGRCQDLIRAGFFDGNTAACENHFRR